MTENPQTRLILSTDYELFFHRSGTVQRCLVDPAERLLEFTARQGMKMTFFVDTGMLRCLDRHAAEHRDLAREADVIRAQLRKISAAGHELGLHIHPHWEDTRLTGGEWDFSDTRYRLDMFSDDEVVNLLETNFELLQALSDEPVVSYRAGGFCIEPFERIGPTLARLGITVDSSVVPGTRLDDPQKGFDASQAPDEPCWRFDASPRQPAREGAFCEVAITPLTVGRFYFWGRLLNRLGGSKGGEHFGDGVSKAIGRAEVFRRLLGRSRISELSMDDAKSQLLLHALAAEPARRAWHVMGHPKLLSERSLQRLEKFAAAAKVADGVTVATFARHC
mgnify:CR=1 FL=1